MAPDAGRDPLRSTRKRSRSWTSNDRAAILTQHRNRTFRGIRMNSLTSAAAFAAHRAARSLAATFRRALAGGAAGAPTGFISGVVRARAGPEAGVWVIAETKELQTPFIKIVVTDDAGRYVLPELPTATYSVWVRGYGLVDSDSASKVAPATRRSNLTAEASQARPRRPRRSIPATTGCRCCSRRRERVSRHGRRAATAFGPRCDAGPLDQQHQDRLQLLPSARQPDHALARPHGSKPG